MVQIVRKGGLTPSLRHVFKKPFGLPKKADPNFRASEAGEDFGVEDADFRSYLNTKVYTQIEFPAGKYFDLNGKEQTYEGVVLQTILAEVTRTKNIITTAIQGRDGTIKEYISNGDYLITLTGGVIGETVNGIINDAHGFYPAIDVQRLVDICNIPDAIEINSGFLAQFFTGPVVITDHTMNQLAGFRDFQPFQISLLSDNAIELDELETVNIINMQTRVSSEPIIITGNILPEVIIT